MIIEGAHQIVYPALSELPKAHYTVRKPLALTLTSMFSPEPVCLLSRSRSHTFVRPPRVLSPALSLPVAFLLSRAISSP